MSSTIYCINPPGRVKCLELRNRTLRRKRAVDHELEMSIALIFRICGNSEVKRRSREELLNFLLRLKEQWDQKGPMGQESSHHVTIHKHETALERIEICLARTSRDGARFSKRLRCSRL